MGWGCGSLYLVDSFVACSASLFIGGDSAKRQMKELQDGVSHSLAHQMLCDTVCICTVS